MRIHIVCTEFDVLAGPGGPGWSGRALHVRGLAGALSAGGHDVTVHCRRGVGTGGEPPESGPVVEHLPDAPGALREHLARTFAERPPDVVHAVDGAAGVGAADAARAAGSALVQSFTSVRGADGDPSAQDVLLRRAERVAATSEAQADDLVRRGAPRSRLRVVPPGVDAGRWLPDGDTLRRGQGARVVVVGSLEPGGGAEDAVAALRHVPDTELYVAGGPPPERQGDPDLTRLQELAARLGVARRVRFLGAVAQHDVGRLMRSADVVVCPSRHGGCGSTVLEAMSCGRPVVATAAGCQRDIVVDGVTGVQVRPGRPLELGTALRGVMGDVPGAQAYGIAGRDRVLARYTWERIAGSTADLYSDAVRELHPPEPEPRIEVIPEPAELREPGPDDRPVATAAG